MSVQKFIVNRESSNFTIISNKVIQGLKNNLELLGFYAYLLSLPPNWVFYKNQLKETCNIGVHKLERLLKELVQMNLIALVQNRSEKGQFAHFELTVLNGDSFKINSLEESVQPCYQNRTTENRATDISTYKRNTLQIENKEKINISCASESDARVDNFFDEFWKVYPVKKNKKRTKQIWEKKKYDEIAPLILSDIEKRKKIDHQWQNVQYIPHASTYLNGELWQDEIIERNPSKPKTYSSINNNNETKCTIKEYGPGHPTWELNEEWRRKHDSQGCDSNRDKPRGNGVQSIKALLF